MTSSNIKLEELFHKALEFDSVDARNIFLEQACAESPQLRLRLIRMLDSCNQTGDTLGIYPSPTSPQIDETQDAIDASSQQRFRVNRQLPQWFGNYELLEKIASGGMGVVYKARQKNLNRIVAIKMILAGQFAGEQEIERFQVEAEAAGKLDHPGIVPVFDVGCFQDQHYFSMAFVDGESLADKITRGPMPPREAASLARKIADAIQVAHDQGIVHRDLKPGNVLLDGREQPRITDFGLAKRVEGDSELTTTGMVLGTPRYMPPEQALGKDISTAADVYSIGAILYAMLTGQAPFEGSTQLEVIMQVINEEPVMLQMVDKSIPKDLEVICLKCLEKNAADRFDSAKDLADDLQRFLIGEPIRAKNDLWRRFRKWTIREPVFAVHLKATAILLAILFINYWIWQDNGLGRDYNFRVLIGNAGILAGWAFAVMILQKAKNTYPNKPAIPLVWAGINPTFLTLTLGWNAEPGNGEYLGWLVSLYLLIIVSSCFFRRVELVVIATVASLVGYFVLLLFCFDQTWEAPAYKVVFGVNLAVTGSLLSLLTARLKRLEEHNEL